MASSAVQPPFDYNSLDSKKREKVETATRRLHTLERQTSEAIIEIGTELISVKDNLPHGQFGPWLDAEFGWSYRTAKNFMDVADRFKSANFSDLDHIAPSALYLLAAESTPEAVRIDFTNFSEMGKTVRHKDVKQAIHEHKQKQEIPVADWKGEVVDAETGELLDEDEGDDDEPPPFEYVDKADPWSHLHSGRSVEPAHTVADSVSRTLNAPLTNNDYFDKRAHDLAHVLTEELGAEGAQIVCGNAYNLLLATSKNTS